MYRLTKIFEAIIYNSSLKKYQNKKGDIRWAN